MSIQTNWAWCHKCESLFYTFNAILSRCAAGGLHEAVNSYDYALVHDDPGAPGQSNWRYCHKCHGLFFNGSLTSGTCPARPIGIGHEPDITTNYVLTHDDPNASGQLNWRWCHKCQGLFFNGHPTSGRCPAGPLGQGHEAAGYNYSLFAGSGKWTLLPGSTEILAVHAALLPKGKTEAQNLGTILIFSGSDYDQANHDRGLIDHTREWDIATGALTTVSSINDGHDLFCCGHAFLANGNLLAAGGTEAYRDDDPDHPHFHHWPGLRNSSIYYSDFPHPTLGRGRSLRPVDIGPAPGMWISSDPMSVNLDQFPVGLGRCPAGKSHDTLGSADYFLSQNNPQALGQHNWRQCGKCRGLFFGGHSVQRPCPAGGMHDPSGSSDYALSLNDSGSSVQFGWRWCHKCQGLFYAATSAGNHCPGGGSHDASGSGDYALIYSNPDATYESGWKWCRKCHGLFFGADTGGRWYPTLVTIGGGSVLAMGGHPAREDVRHSNTSTEIFFPASQQWQNFFLEPASVLEALAVERPDPFDDTHDLHNWPEQYPRVHYLGNGDVFVVRLTGGLTREPQDHSWILPTAGLPQNFQWRDLGPAPCDIVSADGIQQTYSNGAYYLTTSVLLPLLPPDYSPRVLHVGTRQPQIIDLGDYRNAVWYDTSPRNLPSAPNHRENPLRRHCNAVLLPDGTVLVVGGSDDDGFGSDSRGVLEPEIYNPVSDRWTTMAPMSIVRHYHSVALLLPDGSVWVSGSSPNDGSRKLSMEQFAPPYLSRGPRPAIIACPKVVACGASFNVSTPDGLFISAAVLIRCGSVTHGFNSDQRYIRLVMQHQGSTELTLLAPSRNVATLGYHMLFLLSRYDVPSIARFIQLG